MSDFAYALPIFPHDSVAITVTTTVWIGVCVVAFFNTRLGWTLSGLVVPGYLVPLLLVKPLAAGVIAGESIVTYLAVYWLSQRLLPALGCCNFFGRDRFLIIVATTVLVRALTDGWLLPSVGAWCNERYGTTLDYHNDLHSYGLVMVALLANCLWKPGLIRGSLPMLVTVLTTYLIIRYGLSVATNFNVGNLQSMYDDVATSLLASPKAYMVVLIGAYVASSMNLAYGWEFNGILVPALLALQWHDPAKIAVTLLEAAVIMTVAKLVLYLPLFKGMTIEGARKIAIFFTICFLYRLALNHAVPRWLPEYRVTDLFGFGYLLSTLIAIRAYQHERKIQLIRSILQASMMGAVGGTAVGFLFTVVGIPLDLLPVGELPAPAPVFTSEQSVLQIQVLHAHKLSLYRRPGAAKPLTSGSREVAVFRRALTLIRQSQSESAGRFPAELRPAELPSTSPLPGATETGPMSLTASPSERRGAKLHGASQLLATIGYECSLIEDRYVLLSEAPPARGRGLFLFDLARSSELVIEVPAPADEPGTIEAALGIFQQNHAAALAVAGGPAFERTGGQYYDMLNQQGTLFAMFHRLPEHRSVVQVRGLTPYSGRRLQGTRRAAAKPPDDDAVARQEEQFASSLWVRSGLPQGLNLNSLRESIGDFAMHSQAAPLANVLRDSTPANFAELFLNQRDRRILRTEAGLRNQDPAAGSLLTVHEETPFGWLLAQKSQIAQRGSEQYVPCTIEELLYLDQEVLQPILGVLATTSDWESLHVDQREQLQSAAMSARMFGYELEIFRDRARSQDFLVFHESLPRTRHWGTFVFRWTLTQPCVIEVPHPILEQNTFEFGVGLFRRAEAGALLVAGADPRANLDGSADTLRYRNRVNLVNLVRDVLWRTAKDANRLLVHARAIRAPVNADMLIAIDRGLITAEQFTPLQRQLVQLLHDDGLTTQLLDGSAVTAGYEVPGFLLETVQAAHANKELAIAWLSPGLRHLYTQQSEGDLLDGMFQALEIATTHQKLVDLLTTSGTRPLPRDDAARVRHCAEEFLANYDIVRLRLLQQATRGWPMIRVIDATAGQSFLCVRHADGAVAAIVNLRAIDPGSHIAVPAGTIGAAALEAFIESRIALLEVEP